MTALTWEQVRAWRARRHGLDARAPASQWLAVALAAFLGGELALAYV